MKKKLKCLVMLLLVCGFCVAQQVVSSGGYSSKSEVSVDWIIGGSLCDIPLAEVSAPGVSTRELLIEAGVSVIVFPNPTRDFLNIEITPADTGRIVLEIFNVSGRKVLNKSVEHESIMEVDISDMSSGIYFLKVFNPGSDLPFWVEKIVKE